MYLLISVNFILFLFVIYLMYKNNNNIKSYISNVLSSENDKNFLMLEKRLLDITEKIMQQKTEIESDFESYTENKLFSINNDINVINKKINSDEFNNLLYTDKLKIDIINYILNDYNIKQNILNNIKNNYIDTYFENYNKTFINLYKDILENLKSDIEPSNNVPVTNESAKTANTLINVENNKEIKINDELVADVKTSDISENTETTKTENLSEDDIIDKQYNDIVENMKINKPAITKNEEGGLNMNFKSKTDIY